jgi:hypothetical protein
MDEIAFAKAVTGGQAAYVEIHTKMTSKHSGRGGYNGWRMFAEESNMPEQMWFVDGGR